MRRPHAIRRAVSIEYSAYYGSAVDDGDTSTSLFEDCLFERNYGATKGGAYFAFGSSKARFSRCKFMANAVSAQRDHTRALLYLKRALQLDPACVYALSLRGHELVAINDLDGAAEAFREATRVNPRHYNAWYGLGTVFFKQQRHAATAPQRQRQHPPRLLRQLLHQRLRLRQRRPHPPGQLLQERLAVAAPG